MCCTAHAEHAVIIFFQSSDSFVEWIVDDNVCEFSMQSVG